MKLLITILGPTASGKTAFAANIADRLGGEIISADSRQVYRKMDIGTGKDYDDYIVEDRRIPFHLIDLVEPGYKYSVFEYQRDFATAWHDITGRGRQPVLCGGSGMYLEAVLDAWKLINVPHNELLRRVLSSKTDDELSAILASYKKLHNVSDTSSRKRLIRAIEIEAYISDRKDLPFDFPKFESVIFGLRSDPGIRRERITMRLGERLEGMISEVKQLLDDGIDPEDLIYYGLEYKFVTLYLTGRMDYDEMKTRLNTAIHQFAKRQMTWFRKMERSGYKINWLDTGMSIQSKLELALSIIGQSQPGKI